MNKKVIVFGGDGFCGWPTSLGLSEAGYDVLIVDNLSRRKIDEELECESLTPISEIEERIEAWKEISGKEIKFLEYNIATDYFKLKGALNNFGPQTIVHFAEQRAAPYSMKTDLHKAYTVYNNINATHNILDTITDLGLDIHIVHLGTMGVYGYGTAGSEIPEGYLEVAFPNDIKQEITYPYNPGSIYHMTKCMDNVMFQYYAKNDELRITDLHQGVVWGTNTDETMRDERLINRFDYDGDYGTVLNRFLMQSAIGHPLTVHGTGGQTRAFIHIKDTVKCIKMAIENPPEKGDKVRIFNQMTECHTVKDLAQKISKMTGIEIKNYPNPRNEAPENSLKVKNTNFKKLGWQPITLDDGLMIEVIDIAKKYKDRCNTSKILCKSVWRKDIKV